LYERATVEPPHHAAEEEPERGSDVQAIKTSAKDQGDGTYEINGSKMWVTNGLRSGLVFVLASNSGTGKTKLSRLLIEHMPGLTLAGSATRRQMRPGEIEGRDYLFVDKARFEAMIKRDELLEWATVFDNRYVTRIHGENVKRGKTKRDLAEQLRQDIREFKSKHKLDRLVVVWCASTEVFIKPGPQHATIDQFEKAMERKTWSFALVSAAVSVKVIGGVVRDARVVLGGVAPVPGRARDAEKLLEGKPLDDATCQAAADAALEKAEPLKDNGYKVPLAKVLVRRAILAAARTA